MAKGSQRITIDGRDFMRGICTSPYAEDGFFSSDFAKGINIATVPGVLYNQYPATDISPASSGQFIASYGDATFLGQYKYFVTGTGKFYSYQTSMVLDFTEAGKTYLFGVSDLVQYKGNVFCTSTDDITLATVSGTGNMVYSTNTWWTVTKVKPALQLGTGHPMLVFEDSLWIADGQYIHKWDGTTASANALSLTQDAGITALGIDPGSGKMLIATTQGANFSNTVPKLNKVLIWDGFSSRPLRSVIVDEMVTAFYPVGGTVFVTYGRNLGYWNGSGITFLRRLNRIDPVTYGGNLAYKPHITSINSCLYVVDGTTVLAYESIQGGSPRVFYYAWGQTTGIISQVVTLNLITSLGDENLGISYTQSGVNYFFKFHTRTVSQGTAVGFTDIRTKIFKSDLKIRISMVRVVFADPIAANATPLGIQIISGSGDKTVACEDWTNNTNSGDVRYEHDYMVRATTTRGDELTDFYLWIYGGGSNYSGIRKIIVFYDIVE